MSRQPGLPTWFACRALDSFSIVPPEPYATSCCSEDGSVALPTERAPDVCYPILIPRNDPVFAPYRQGCMNFVRSTTDAMQGCGNAYEPAEQVPPGSAPSWRGDSIRTRDP